MKSKIYELDQYSDVNEQEWYLETYTGDILSTWYKVGKKISLLDYSLLMFLPQHHLIIFYLTNIVLTEKRIPCRSLCKIWQFFGVYILVT